MWADKQKIFWVVYEAVMDLCTLEYRKPWKQSIEYGSREICDFEYSLAEVNNLSTDDTA